MTLENWLKAGLLHKHETSPDEIKNLLGIVNRDLHDSGITEVSSDTRFKSAYNAALQASLIALYAEGFKPVRDRTHLYGIESLRHTIEFSADDITELKKLQKKRHQTNYDFAGAISPQEADRMTKLAEIISNKVLQWMKEEHSELMKLD